MMQAADTGRQAHENGGYDNETRKTTAPRVAPFWRPFSTPRHLLRCIAPSPLATAHTRASRSRSSDADG